MDIHGGKGICMGPNNYLAQSFIEGPISITVEGANILTRSLIIFGQGAVRCHPFVLKEMESAKSQDIVEFDKALFAHIGFIISNKVRAFFLSLTKGYLTKAPAGKLKRYYQQLSQFSASFALVADISMLTIGGKLKRKEKLSGRLADILSLLYMGSAVLKYYELEEDEEAFPFVRWVSEEILFRLQTQLHGFLLNLPNRFLAWALRATVFPLGQRLKPPSDNRNSQVARLLLYPSRVRDHLAKHVYIKNTEHNPVGLIESVLQQVVATEPLEKRIRLALRQKTIKGKNFDEIVAAAAVADIVNKKEAEQLLSAYEARMKIINVDDFAPEEFG